MNNNQHDSIWVDGFSLLRFTEQITSKRQRWPASMIGKFQKPKYKTTRHGPNMNFM